MTQDEREQAASTKKKVYRHRQTRPGRLECYFGKSEDGDVDVVYGYGGSGASRADSRLLCTFFENLTYNCFTGEKNLRQHLAERGYDLTTLRFSIQRKREEGKAGGA